VIGTLGYPGFGDKKKEIWVGSRREEKKIIGGAELPCWKKRDALGEKGGLKERTSNLYKAGGGVGILLDRHVQQKFLKWERTK